MVHSVADQNHTPKVSVVMKDFSRMGIPRGMVLHNHSLIIAADSAIARVSTEGEGLLEILASQVPDGEGVLAQGIQLSDSRDLLWFSRFYGGLYSLDLGSKRVSKVANSTYGTFGLVYNNANLFYTVESAAPVSPAGDILLVSLGHARPTNGEQALCRACASSGPTYTTAI